MTQTKSEGKERSFTPSDYNRVVQGTALLAVSLMKSSFEVKPDFYNQAQKRDLSYDTEVVSSAYSAEDGTLSGIFQFGVHAKSGRKVIFKCTGEYFIVYEASAELSADAAEAFCEHVGMFAAFPYFRAWVSQAAWAANIRLPPLPTISAMNRDIPGLQKEQKATLPEPPAKAPK